MNKKFLAIVTFAFLNAEENPFSVFDLDFWNYNAGIVMNFGDSYDCLLYTSPSPRDYAASRMPSSA